MKTEDRLMDLEKENQTLRSQLADLLIRNDYMEQYYAAMVYGSLFSYEIDATTDSVTKLPEGLYTFLKLESGSSYTQLLTSICKNLISEDDAPMVQNKTSCRALIDGFHASERQISVEYQSKEADTIGWYRIRIYLIRHPVSGHICGVCTIRSINAQKDSEQQLMDRARLDPLTKLYNRRSMEELVKKELTDPEKKHGVMLIDIDNFKYINDRFGHLTGDAVLSHFASMLAKKFRQYDIVSRIGGDEFLVFMKTAEKEIVMRRAEDIVHSCSSVMPQNPEIPVTPSIGISIYPRDGHTITELYAKADIALYASKHAGKNRATEYNANLSKEENEE